VKTLPVPVLTRGSCRCQRIRQASRFAYRQHRQQRCYVACAAATLQPMSVIGLCFVCALHLPKKKATCTSTRYDPKQPTSGLVTRHDLQSAYLAPFHAGIAKHALLHRQTRIHRHLSMDAGQRVSWERHGADLAHECSDAYTEGLSHRSQRSSKLLDTSHVTVVHRSK